MSAGQRYAVTVDLVNAGGAWSFSIQMSVGGAPWSQIPVEQLTMPEDRQKPLFDLAFNTMAVGTTGPINDTNRIFKNLLMTGGAKIGSLNGKQCMLVTGQGSTVANYQKNAQGVRSRAFKAITMMVCITTRTAGLKSISPALFNFFNTVNSSTAGLPRMGAPTEPVNYSARNPSLSMYLLSGQLSLQLRDDSRGVMSQYYPNVQPITYNQWNHIAIVWDDDWSGYAFYINGALVGQLRAPGPDVKLIFEQFRIGSMEGQDGAGWTGGIAWFRGFDHRLGPSDIKTDMNDGWASL